MIKKYFSFLIYCLVLFSSYAQGQNLDEAQISFLQKKAKTICVDETLSNPNWKPLAAQLKNKRIVLIGEFNHGSKEIFQLRNDLIRYLHEEMGYNTVLFESGIGELILPELKKQELTESQMINGLFGGWRTKEFKDLMGYIKGENISIAGFDVQRSGGSFNQLLIDLAIKKGIDTIFYAQLENRYGHLQRELSNRKIGYDSIQTPTQQLMSDYQKMYDLLQENKPSKVLLFTLRTLLNRKAYLQYMLQFVKNQNWSQRWAARDSMMADNITWLQDHFYQHEKLIVIAHNFHIARYSEKEQVMGEMLAPRYGPEMYTLGVFAGGGTFANNAGKEEQMLPADTSKLDIQHVIATTKGFATYLNIPKSKAKGSEWLNQAIVVNNTFIDLSNSNSLILSKHFDGLIFLDKVSVPEKP